MIENIFMIVLAVLILPVGIGNIKGNISSIHWYNRIRVNEENRCEYGKLMGMAAVGIALGIGLKGLLSLIFKGVVTVIIPALFLIAGIVVIIYAQIKYNKGIF